MAKKTKCPISLKNTGIVGSSSSLILPVLKLRSTTPSPDEDKGFSAGWDEAIAVGELNDKRKVKEDEIEKLESYVSKTPRELLEKVESLKAAKQALRNLTEPKRLNQRHKLKVRKIAKEIWQKYPECTIQKLIKSDKVKAATTPRVYTERTLRDWIKDLAPNRRPGRRTKTR